MAACVVNANFWAIYSGDVFWNGTTFIHYALWIIHSPPYDYAIGIKDVRAHCYCASLVHTLYKTWRVPRHVFQARAPSLNWTKYRAEDLCGNLICECFFWMLGDPHFFFDRSLPFLTLFMILKKKICVWEVLIISHILLKKGRIGTWIQVCVT